jgi:2-amino-4-hydroxy-6-hydroxymethyldihydropteridine diphosphokinase
MPRAAERVLVTLGSNIDPERNLPEAVRRLAERVEVRAVSRVYESAAVAGPAATPVAAATKIEGPTPINATFLNAAVEIVTGLEPAQLKRDLLRPLEAELGRVRTADRNAPRTIDLDLSLYGDRVIDDPAQRLVLPDPDILRFAHVALPLADVAPALRHPVSGQTLREIAAALADPRRIRVRRDCRLPTPQPPTRPPA